MMITGIVVVRLLFLSLATELHLALGNPDTLISVAGDMHTHRFLHRPWSKSIA